MATPRRIQLATVSHSVSLHSAVTKHSGSDLPHGPGLVTPPAEGSLSARVELLLFEPDDARCAEFHYPELTALVKYNQHSTRTSPRFYR